MGCFRTEERALSGIEKMCNDSSLCEQVTWPALLMDKDLQPCQNQLAPQKVAPAKHSQVSVVFGLCKFS